MLTASVAIAIGLGLTSEASGQGCHESSILTPAPFMGNNGEIFRLADGSIWEVKFEYEYLYEYYPRVTVCPGRGVLIINDKALNIQQIVPSGGSPRAPRPTQPSRPGQALELTTRNDEFSFYDSRGSATAYLDLSAGLTFYLWSGEAVAYLDDDSLYGFNGKHLGWYQNGLVYDRSGGVVAAPASAFSEPLSPAPPRSPKGLRPLKGLKELKPLKPLFGRAWSTMPPEVFFLLGTR